MRRQGFTLVELAIVLVIIGLIMGAVLKGKDLIENARIKKFVSDVKQWEIYQWTFYDRMGRYAGDQDKSGIIGDNDTDNAKEDLKENANFIDSDTIDNKIKLGSNTFYLYYGYYTDNNDHKHNAIFVCSSSDCSGNFTKDERAYLSSLDRIIDGVTGTDGSVFCINKNISSDVDESRWIVPVNSTLNNTSEIVDCFNSTAEIKTLIYRF